MVQEIVSFGEWVQTRRNQLGLPRNSLARQVGCSPVTIKKIERGERRPSVQIAQLLVKHLHIAQPHQQAFLRMARGEFVENLPLDEEPYHHYQNQKPNRAKVLGRLDILPDQKLFGVEAIRQRIINVVAQTDRPWLIALEGLGGLGKTSLANEIVHHFLNSERFADIGWVSAKQEEYITGRGIQPIKRSVPALNAEVLIDLLLVQLSDGPYPVHSQEAKRTALLELLKVKPCLIVIDNLETAEDYLAVLPLLRFLAQPSKFLITSRMSLQNESDVYGHNLRELSEKDAFQFLRYEAGLQRVLLLAAATDDELKMIYTAVGGNPLALKLIIGQSQLLPLKYILENLQEAEESQVDELYTYIYWQAWQMLDENGRQLLLSLPLVPNGTFEQLLIASKLSPLELQSALSDLRRLSLIEIGGELRNPRYRLHRLTESFLMNEVVQWQANEHTAERLYFHERIQAMVEHWQSEKPLLQSEVETLDEEKDGILKVLHLGLTIEAYWPIIKPLIFSLTGYMERRGHWQAWQQTVGSAIDVAQKVNDQPGKMELLGVLGRVLQRQNLADEVIQNYRRVIRLARQLDNKVEEARASSNLGYVLILKGQYWRSETYSCHAMRIFSDLNHQHGQAHTHNHLGILYSRQRKWDKAQAHLQEACHIWEEMNDLPGLQYGLGNLGQIHNEMDQPVVAIDYLQKAQEILQEIGDQGELAGSYLNLAIAYEKLADFEQALSCIKQAENLYEGQRNLLGVSESWEIIGSILLKTEQEETAESYFEAALEGYQSLQNMAGQLRIESRMLSLFIKQNQTELAEASAAVVRQIIEENDPLRGNRFAAEALAQYELLNTDD